MKSDGSIIIDTQINTDGVDDGIKSVQSKMKSFGSAMTNFGGKMSLAVTAPLTALGGKMVSSASDMEENLNKVDVAFGKSADKVKSWADIATESFGLSKNQALEAASLFGDMATSMGLPQDAAADMSTSLAGLAGDLASFKNIDIEQAMTALNGIFTGETESLKTLGVVMTETNLKQFAEDVGLVYNEMSQAEKVQLRYAYVMEKTANAQGDYARTSDGTANSMRTLQASFDNLITSLGESLLPVITPIIQSITDIIKKFSEMSPVTQKIIVGIGLFVAALGPLLSIVGSVCSIIGTLMPLLSGVTIAFNPVVLAIVAAAAALLILVANWEKVTEVMTKFDEFLQGVFATDFTEIFGPILGSIMNGFFANVKNIWESIKQIFNGIITFIKGVFSGDWEQAWNGVKDIFAGVWNLLVSVIKIPINNIIGMINGLVGGVVSGINMVIRALNGLKFDVPDWIPGIGGNSVGFSISEVSAPKIPYLAAGAVIPPNAPFMAMLGDQRHGTNLEAPESLIRKIFREEIGNKNGNNATYHFVAQLDGRTLFEEFINEARLKQMGTGKNILQTL